MDDLRLRELPLWRISGRVLGTTEAQSKARPRTVWLAAADFGEASERAEAALLHNWSKQPHIAIVLSIVPVMEKDSEQTAALFPYEPTGDER